MAPPRLREGQQTFIATGILAVVLAFSRRQEPKQEFDPRTPEQIREVLRDRPWKKQRLLCDEGGNRTFYDSDFWSPASVKDWDERVLLYFWALTSRFDELQVTSIAALHKHFLARLDATKDQPYVREGILQIGPNTLSDAEKTTLWALDQVVANRGHLVLVDALPDVIENLTQNAMSLRLGPERTRVLNAAMCPDADQQLSLWRFKDGFLPPEQMRTARMWSTLAGKDTLLSTFFRNALEFPELRQRVGVDLDPFIERLPVRCHTPTSLLREVGLSAAELGYVMVDAEGYDAEILLDFMALPDFAPWVIIFEWAFHHGARGKISLVTRVANHWAARGYALAMNLDNLVIFRTQ